ncbi:MAG: 23S rRNA (adenine(2503)-C(2))-methyltransferase RlmN [Elusimicrobia bacterium CG03_land_8_20_14_0_80_50_18]|nr:MAG: 23S rRNA (adenine(2503)-C(2))-methyltransferase RlmN [Elusimicrobia bacterium CG03_land_8_20_14_0_80_50_18]PIX16163.1 MAG: 23S rRNA (adenine(2503)-C(2))-methyltransferase RlmN [Elusimicrobia bacterium CG_4_8_14_3_um_filter_50_9]
MKDIRNLTREELKEVCTSRGVPAFHAQQIFEWLYRKRVNDFSLMPNVPLKFREYLKTDFFISEVAVLQKEISSDGTAKFLLGLQDGLAVESVLIPEKKRRTLCVSTQAGCKFGCKFCVSGLNGFKRNLSPAEICGQLLAVEKESGEKVTNIVFMGVGEPLDNFDNVMKASAIFMDNRGLEIGKRKIVLSTCGVVPGIERLAESGAGLRISISLHSADDRKRSQIMPVNKKWNTGQLMKALKKFYEKEQFAITFEYILISGFNSSEKDAEALSMYVKGVPRKLNIIPYNPSEHFKWKAPTGEELGDFVGVLKEKGVFYTLRRSRGSDISAACGQLQAKLK